MNITFIPARWWLAGLLAGVPAVLAPQAFGGFELIENAAAPGALTSSVTSSQDVAQMEQTIAALRHEIQGLRVRLAASEADARGSRQELLAIRAQQEQIQTSINHMTLTFAFGHSRFGPSAADGQALVDAAMAAHSVRIFGYTDSVGTLSGNKRVAQLRADAARAYLERRGIPPAKISAQGRVGNYIATNDTEAGRSANRRVEFDFVGKP